MWIIKKLSTNDGYAVGASQSPEDWQELRRFETLDKAMLCIHFLNGGDHVGDQKTAEIAALRICKLVEAPMIERINALESLIASLRLGSSTNVVTP